MPEHCWGSRRIYDAWLNVHLERLELRRAIGPTADRTGEGIPADELAQAALDVAFAGHTTALEELRDANREARNWRSHF